MQEYNANMCMKTTSNICMNTASNVCMNATSNICRNTAFRACANYFTAWSDLGGAEDKHFTLDLRRVYDIWGYLDIISTEHLPSYGTIAGSVMGGRLRLTAQHFECRLRFLKQMRSCITYSYTYLYIHIYVYMYIYTYLPQYIHIYIHYSMHAFMYTWQRPINSRQGQHDEVYCGQPL